MFFVVFAMSLFDCVIWIERRKGLVMVVEMMHNLLGKEVCSTTAGLCSCVQPHRVYDCVKSVMPKFFNPILARILRSFSVSEGAVFYVL